MISNISRTGHRLYILQSEKRKCVIYKYQRITCIHWLFENRSLSFLPLSRTIIIERHVATIIIVSGLPDRSTYCVEQDDVGYVIERRRS